jgi:hypothetical protein
MSINPVLVARFSREYASAIRNEENAPTETAAWSLARASERCLRRLQAARAGLPLPTSRVTRRSRARQGFAVLAMIGRVIERAVRREVALRKAQIANRIARGARVVRRSLRVVLQTISRLIVSTIGKGKIMFATVSRDQHFARLNAYRNSVEYAEYAKIIGVEMSDGPRPSLIGARWQIDERIFNEFLELLPPLGWNGSSFYMSEFCFSDITTKYTREGDRYFCEFARRPTRKIATPPPCDHDAIRSNDAAWFALRFVGIQQDTTDDGRPAPLELRDCSCGSTLCRPAVLCHYCGGSENFEIDANGKCSACGGTNVHPEGDDPHDDGEEWDVKDCGVCHPVTTIVTAENITDDQIRDYARDHWRDPWMDGGPGKGCVNDARIIFFSTTTSHEGRSSIRAEFARLINTRNNHKGE